MAERDDVTVPEILSINNPKAIPTAIRVLREHGIIVFPTDTIYGIAADVFSTIGINKIYKVKQRPKDKALPVLIGDLAQLDSLVQPISQKTHRIIKSFWPGPLTVIMLKSLKIPRNSHHTQPLVSGCQTWHLRCNYCGKLDP